MKITKEELVEIIKEEVQNIKYRIGSLPNEEMLKTKLGKGAQDSFNLAFDQEDRADEYATDAEKASGSPEAVREGEMAMDFYSGAYNEYRMQFLIGKELMRTGKKGAARVKAKIAYLKEANPGTGMPMEEKVED
jgi:hypothetical protein